MSHIRTMINAARERVHVQLASLRDRLSEYIQASKWKEYGKALRLNGQTLRIRMGEMTGDLNTLLNRATGYEECERLRSIVKRCDKEYERVRGELRQARNDFEAAIGRRSQCQKELNALLQRKQSWLDDDLMRFTDLYRSEMKLEQAEAEARSKNNALEREVDCAHQRLMDALRERYQEEQLWSDKIRRISTFGTFSLMGLNVLLFLLIQMAIEPRKRALLIQDFTAVMKDKLDEISRLSNAIDDTRPPLSQETMAIGAVKPLEMVSKKECAQMAMALISLIILGNAISRLLSI